MAETGISYRLTTPAGQVVFNDPTIGPPYYRLQRVTGMDGGTMRVNVEDVPMRDLGIVFDAFEGPAYPVLEGVITAADPAPRQLKEDFLRTCLDSLKRADGTLDWLPSGQATRRQRTVRIAERIDIPGESGTVLKRFLIPLVAKDPRAYSETQQTATSSALGVSGVLGPPPFFIFQRVQSGGNLSLTAGGSVDTYPIVRFTGPITGPAIRNQTTGKTVSFPSLTVVAGNYLEIDMRNESAILNSDPNQPMERYLDAAASEFWALQANVPNLIKLSGTAYSGATVASVLYRNAFKG